MEKFGKLEILRDIDIALKEARDDHAIIPNIIFEIIDEVKKEHGLPL